MTEPRVHVVEDDAELRSILLRGLREEGFAVTLASTGAELLRQLERADPDAVVVDIGLPDGDGRDVVQALRAHGVAAPVIFLTALDALPDRLAGFAAGGDDYLTKPFALAELVARLRAIMRRSGGSAATTVGLLRVDPAAHTVSVGETAIDLTPTEFRLLARLAGAPGEAVRRRELVEAAWPHGAIVHDNTLDVYVARLRRKLGAVDGAPALATVHGVGYRLE